MRTTNQTDVSENHTKQDNPQTPMEVVQAWFKTLDSNLLDDEIEWSVPGYPVEKEKYSGQREIFEEFFPALTSQFAEWGAEPERMIDGGDDITVIGRYVAKTNAGRSVTIRFIHVWTVKNSKIIRVVSSADTSVFSRVLQ